MFKKAIPVEVLLSVFSGRDRRGFSPEQENRSSQVSEADEEGILKTIPLFHAGDGIKRMKAVCRVINTVLPVASIWVFGVGLYSMLSSDIRLNYEFNGWALGGLLVLSLALHEAGHVVAGIAYGYEIGEIGLLRLWIIPFGAYVGYCEKDNASRAEKIQFSLAGIETNLLIAGICLFGAMFYYPMSFTLALTAKMNVLFAAINLLPAAGFGFDGSSVLGTLLNIEDLGKAAKKWLNSRKGRRILLHSGPQGWIKFCAFALTRFSEALVWLLFGFDIFSIIFNLV